MNGHATFLLAWGLVAHLVADFFLQTEGMAIHKVNVRRPEGYVHAGLHVLCLLPVFGVWSLLIGVTHWCIDLRTPLAWWRKNIGQTKDTANPAFVPFAMLQDQAAHVIILALFAWLLR